MQQIIEKAIDFYNVGMVEAGLYFDLSDQLLNHILLT